MFTKGMELFVELRMGFVVQSKQTSSADKLSDTRVVEVQGKRDCVLQQERLLQQQEKLLRLLQQKEQDLDTLR